MDMDARTSRKLRDRQSRARTSSDRARADLAALRLAVQEANDAGYGYGTIAKVLDVSKARIQQIVNSAR